VIGYIFSVRSGTLRTVLIISLPLALPPAFFTLNRGMFLSLGVGLLVLSVKALMRGRVIMIATVASLGVVFWVASLLIPVSALIATRLDSSDSTADRLGLYIEALKLAQQSPLLGFGVPTSVDTVTADAPVGTQGQLWLVLVSHGLPALIAFAGWLIVVIRGSMRARTAGGEWLAMVPLIALVQMPFYGLTYQNLAVVFFAVGLTYGLLNGPLPERLKPKLLGFGAPAAATGSPAGRAPHTGQTPVGVR
jgi:O-antigen ligase